MKPTFRPLIAVLLWAGLAHSLSIEPSRVPELITSQCYNDTTQDFGHHQNQADVHHGQSLESFIALIEKIETHLERNNRPATALELAKALLRR